MWAGLSVGGIGKCADTADPAPRRSARSLTLPLRCRQVPVPHFGIVLDVDNFHQLAGRVAAAGIPFVIAVRKRGPVSL